MRFQIQHSSLSVFGSPREHRHDAAQVFTLGSHVVTGTEAGAASNSLPRNLRDEAEAHGYRLFLPTRRTDCWVAVKADRIVRRSWDQGYIPLLPGAKAAGDPHPYAARGIVWAQWEDKTLGVISQSSFHMLTKGRRPGEAQKHRPGDPVDHFQANIRFGRALGDWAIEHGKGARLAFCNGDSNLDDTVADVFAGKPLTTCWDELGKHPGTGHGNVDVIASYDRDGRVKCLNAQVLRDDKLRLYSDHHTIVATYEIEPLKRRA